MFPNILLQYTDLTKAKSYTMGISFLHKEKTRTKGIFLLVRMSPDIWESNSLLPAHEQAEAFRDNL